LKRFKEITSGHPVIMGRKTWESLPEKFRPLPDRLNIIVTRQLDYAALGAKICNSLDEAIEKAQGAVGGEEIFIIGGGELYKESIPHAKRLYLTIIDDSKDADVFFPAYENEFTKIIESHPRDSNGLHYTWLTLDHA
jgi:dihydrofolate reductase